MEALAAAGDRAGAIQHAVAHAALLHRELDAEADPVVADFARRLRQEPLAWTPSEAISPPSAVEPSQPRFPAGPSRRIPPWVPELTRRHATMVGAVSLAAVVVVLGIVVARHGGADSQETPPAAAPGIAVLPFTVQGEGLEVMREGMVSLLSTGLDGAGGLRTIAPATVFARWREQVPGEEAPELPTALEIARRTGARYALVGSAVLIGSTMRVLATVYDVDTGAQLGQGHVEGSPDNVLPLIDRLGVEVLRIILQRGEKDLPEIDMAGLTTESPEALRGYLEGEVHLRHFDIEAARDAYTRAVDADSMFALAHTRLAQAYWWEPQNVTLGGRNLARASQLTDRLPAREALLVRGRRAIWWRSVDELGALREGVRAYPDDAEMWYLLGETLLHLSGAMAPAEQIEAAYKRAVQLDPGNAEYLYHYTQFAWTAHADSQEAVRRVEMFERASSERSAQSRAFRLALDLGFGDSAAQASAMDRLASEDYEMVGEVGVILLHPRYRQNLAVVRMRVQRAEASEIDEATVRLAFAVFSYYGRFQEFLDLLGDPRIKPGHRAFSLYAIRTLGLSVPVESLDESFGSIAVDSIAEPWVIVNVGLYAADQARWSDHQRVIAELERRRTLALLRGDSLSARDSNLLADFVQGYGLWRRRGPEAALPILAAPDQLEHGWWWVSQLYQKLGRFREAERAYQTYGYPRGRYMPTSIHPLTYRELGKVYVALGEYDKAREAYEYFVEYWQDADPELQPMVVEAEQAIIRLKRLGSSATLSSSERNN